LLKARLLLGHDPMRSTLFLLAVLAAIAAGCIGGSCDGVGPTPTSGNEIDCSGLVCDWTVVQGTPIFGPTWHDGDLGIDLSNEGPQVIELRDVLFAANQDRQLALQAAILRDPTATMAFELDFYAPGKDAGATFWDRAPVFLVTRHIDVVPQSVFWFERDVLVPSEGAAVVLRIMKDGTGRAMVDELTLGPPP
jgi:hypothetical protein